MPISRTSFRLRAMYSSFVGLEVRDLGTLPARRRESAGRRRSSPARGREMSENMAWMRSKRSWMRRPKYCTMMLAIGSGRKAHSVSLGLIVQHEDQRADGEDHGVGRVHDAGPEQHANGVQVVGGARHDVAGARALVEAVGSSGSRWRRGRCAGRTRSRARCRSGSSASGTERCPCSTRSPPAASTR